MDDDGRAALARTLCDVAEAVAREAGALIRDGRPDRVAVAATKSSPQDVVTAMDLASERLLRRRLAELRPHDAVLGEEGGFEPGASGVTWVVDPIDGTVNYLYGLPYHAVSVAAVVGPDDERPSPSTWTVLAGCVHAPALDRTYTAALGAGAWRDGHALRREVWPDRLASSLVGTGFGYTERRRRAQGRVLAELIGSVRDIRRLGAAALDLCAVADGSLDLYFERGLNPWDQAAGGLVATEAGATLRGLRGAPPDEAMVVAGPPDLIGLLTDVLERLDADRDD
jgi:myo-inositol-1(or 4)-monophosphatase